MTNPNRQAFWLLKDVNRAVRDYSMIHSGDRVAVALSGGKDSFSLLRLLDLRRRTALEPYDLLAIHINADGRGSWKSVHPPLLAWLELSGIPFVIRPLILPSSEPLPLDCRRCTWNRRRALFEAARAEGCTTVAFGHHADDLAQTTLLNLLYHGVAETMAPARSYFDGALRVIRPLCYVAEKELRRFARANDFPAPPPPCPRANTSRRKFVADLIQTAEKGAQDAKINLLRAGLKNTQGELLSPGQIHQQHQGKDQERGIWDEHAHLVAPGHGVDQHQQQPGHTPQNDRQE